MKHSRHVFRAMPRADDNAPVIEADAMKVPAAVLIVYLDSPYNVPEQLRPRSLGGKGADPIWMLDIASLPECLNYRDDPQVPWRGFIKASKPLTAVEYEVVRSKMRALWKLFT